MSGLPIYDQLYNDTQTNNNIDLTTKQKDEFMKLLKTLDQNGSELIYALVRFYQLENCEDKSTFILPYDGKYLELDKKAIKHGVKYQFQFDLDCFPFHLKQMLYKFIKLHHQSLQNIEEIIPKLTTLILSDNEQEHKE